MFWALQRLPLATVSTKFVEANLPAIPGNVAVCVGLLADGDEVRVVNAGEEFAQVGRVAGKLALEIPK